MNGSPKHSLQTYTNTSGIQGHHRQDPEPRSFPQDINIPNSAEEQQRLQVISDLRLLEHVPIPVFDEATQTAADALKTSFCFIGIMDRDRLWLRSTATLASADLVNTLLSSRPIPRHESFCNRVMKSGQALAIEDTTVDFDYQRLALVSRYGVRAYLGVPLMTASGQCVGTLALMEQEPRPFSVESITTMKLIARWCMSEFERDYLLQRSPSSLSPSSTQSHRFNPDFHPTHPPYPGTDSTRIDDESLQPSDDALCLLKARLISHMTYELQTPLTSILGMTGVLTREIYGPLTDKQKEYMDIIHYSSQYMHSLVKEILDLGELNQQQHIELSAVDIEMFCQQALTTLRQASKQRDQTLQLSVEPGQRIWMLDKSKVRQMLYHLIFRVIQASNAGSTIRIHVSRKGHQLKILIWTSHPWLGEGLPHSELPNPEILNPDSGLESSLNSTSTTVNVLHLASPSGELANSAELAKDVEVASPNTELSPSHRRSVRHVLGLLLSRALAELHGGSLSLQGSLESGYRYVISLPELQPPQTIASKTIPENSSSDRF